VGSNLGKGKKFPLFSKTSIPALWPAPQSSIKQTPQLFPLGETDKRMKLTTHLYPVLRLRKNGSIPLLPIYAFMAWTGKTLPSRFRISKDAVDERQEKKINSYYSIKCCLKLLCYKQFSVTGICQQNRKSQSRKL
jgi:hypothetical protein